MDLQLHPSDWHKSLSQSQQEDYNARHKPCIDWLSKRHINTNDWRDPQTGQRTKNPLIARMCHDDEFLTQQVLRDRISQNPERQHPAVQSTAVYVAKALGVLNIILATYGASRVGGANAQAVTVFDPKAMTCYTYDWGNPQVTIFLCLFSMTLGMFIACVCNHCLGWRPKKPIKPSTRNVSTQSQTTYTSLRGCLTARFLPLPDVSHGAHQD